MDKLNVILLVLCLLIQNLLKNLNNREHQIFHQDG